MFIQSASGYRLAIDTLEGEGPRILFCPGFKSNRNGFKALALHEWCRQTQRSYARFDYSGHGDSDGDWPDMTVTVWLEDLLSVIDQFDEPVLLVGSSMGGWLALLASLRRQSSVAGLLLIACAADMTQTYPDRLVGLTREQDDQGREYVDVPNQYDEQEPYRIYQHLIDDGVQYGLLDGAIDLNCPVRLLHGIADDVVEWERSLRVMRRLTTDDVHLRLLKGRDHRMSEPEDLSILIAELESLIHSI